MLFFITILWTVSLNFIHRTYNKDRAIRRGLCYMERCGVTPHEWSKIYVTYCAVSAVYLHGQAIIIVSITILHQTFWYIKRFTKFFGILVA